MTTYKIILNPASGRGAGKKLRTTIEETLTGLNLDFNLVETNQRWHAAELARHAVSDGFDVVVAAGGDGTANEVLNGLMQADHADEGKAAMGFISVGQGNDYAFGIGVTPDLAEACNILAEDNRRIVDVGLSLGGDYPEGRYFGNGVGIGFDAVVGFEALKLRPLQGFVSYLIAALKTIMVFHQGPRVRIEYNDDEFVQKSIMVSVMNGTRLGGGFMMAPEGEMDDGQFDLSIVDQVGRARIAALIPYFIKGTHANQPEVRTDRTARIVVTALEGVIPAHADGETLCTAGDKLTLEILPQKLEVISPAAEPPE